MDKRTIQGNAWMSEKTEHRLRLAKRLPTVLIIAALALTMIAGAISLAGQSDGERADFTYHAGELLYKAEAVCGGVTVEMSYADGVFPEHTYALFREMTVSGALEAALADSLGAEGEAVAVLGCDIRFFSEDAPGIELQPSGTVNVAFLLSAVPGEYAQALEAEDKTTAVGVFHVDTDADGSPVGSPERLDGPAVSETAEGALTVAFDAETFSGYLMVLAVGNAAPTPGSMTALASAGTSAAAGDIVTISSAEELRAFVAYVNAGKTSSGVTFLLKSDIDTSEQDASITTATGTFQGTFDGGGHTISKLTNSLFSTLAGSIQNLTLSGEITAATVQNNAASTGGFARTSSAATFINCTNQVKISCDNEGYSIGGFVGYEYLSNTFEGCTNAADIASSEWIAGGFVGNQSEGTTLTFRDCVNSGAVKGTQAGGLVGFCGKADGDESTVSGFSAAGCTNSGTITCIEGKNPECVGGLVGYAYAGSVTLANCVNSGYIDNTYSGACNDSGGLVGRTNVLTVDGCTNSGKVLSNGSNNDSGSGGIVGRVVSSLTISGEETLNTAAIGESGSSCEWAGGIVGYLDYDSTARIETVRNTGAVVADCYAGGIVGVTDGDTLHIENAVNTGSVTGSYGTPAAGGILGCWEHMNGSVWHSSGNLRMTDCANSGVITAYNYAGGLTGATYDPEIDAYYYRCHNTGAVQSTGSNGKNIAGGIVGWNDTDEKGAVYLFDCWNSGSVSAPNGDADDDSTGGLIAVSDDVAVIVNCYNSGAISSQAGQLGEAVGDGNAEDTHIYLVGFYGSSGCNVVNADGGKIAATYAYYKTWLGMDSSSGSVGAPSDVGLLSWFSGAQALADKLNTCTENTVISQSYHWYSWISEQAQKPAMNNWQNIYMDSGYEFQTWGIRSGLAAPGVTLGRDVTVDVYLDDVQLAYAPEANLSLAIQGETLYSGHVNESGQTFTFHGVWPGSYDVYYNGKATGKTAVVTSTGDASLVTLRYYTVRFMDGQGAGAAELTTQSILAGRCMEAYTPPAEGKVFVRWQTEDALGTRLDYNAALPVTAPLTLYALWGGNNVIVSALLDGTRPWNGLELELRTENTVKYTLAREAMDGEYVCKVLVDAGTYDIFLSNEDTDVDITVPPYAAGGLTAGSAVLRGYTLSFLDSDGGQPLQNADGSEMKQEIVAGKLPKTPAAPTKEGCLFDGWKKTADGMAAFDFTAKITQGQSAYAAWKRAEGVKVTLRLDDTERLDGRTVTFQKQDEILHTLTGTGGVYEAANVADDTYSVFVDNRDTGRTVTVTEGGGAVEINFYSVKFTGRTGAVLFTQYVPRNGTPERPPDPVETGYAFDGWTDTAGKAYDFSAEISAAAAVSSKWTPITGAHVTLTLNGAAWSDQAVSLRVNGEAVYTLSSSASGQYVSAVLVADGSYTVYVGEENTARKLTVTKSSGSVAVNYYSLSFYSGGKLYKTQYILRGAKPAQAEPPIAQAGASFLGWVTRNGGDTAFDFSEAVNGSASVYAKWDYQSFPVTGVIANGTLEAATANYGEAYRGVLSMEDHYQAPETLQATMNGEPFTGFRYNPARALITIDAETVTGEIVFTGAGKLNTSAVFRVTGEIGHGRLASSAEATSAAGYSGKITAESGYSLPGTLSAVMDGASFSGFTYDSASGAVTVAPGVLTGDLRFFGACAESTTSSYPVSSVVTNGVLFGASANSATGYAGTLQANTGYALPRSITATMDGEPFTAFTYYFGNGVITVDADKVTGALVFYGACVSQNSGLKYSVVASIGGGSLTGTAAYANRSYQAVITPDENCERPASVLITMGGKRFEGFSYDPETGTVTIAAGRVTGNLTIAAVCRNRLSGNVTVAPDISMIPKK